MLVEIITIVSGPPCRLGPPSAAVSQANNEGFTPPRTQAGQEQSTIPREFLFCSRAVGDNAGRMITARQIADWAATGVAQRELPRLVRRLVHTTATTTQITMPAGDSTCSPGLDGELFSHDGNAWVPKGHSCWEASCRQDATVKANEDFAKRVGEIAQLERATRTYVAITARKWPQKAKWATGRRADGQWLDVRAYDADDLEQWIEQSPAVALAFGEELGLSGPGVTSLGAYYKVWSGQCAPVILATAVLAGRDRQAQRILKQCNAATNQAGSSPLPVKSDSVEEAVAFVAAALLTDANLADRSVVVTDVSGWRFVEKNTEIRVAIAARPELAEAPCNRDGLVLVVPYASGDMAKQFPGVAGRLDDPETTLDRADHLEFEKALQAIGLDENDSRRLSTLCGRSWSIFRRQHANNPAVRRPTWLDHPSAPALATLCLISSWSSGKYADKEAIARVAGRSYEDLERDLLALERLDDSPVVHIGTVWKAKSALELLALFGDRITDVEIERFFAEARSTLSTLDPELELEKDKRYAAAIYGKTRPISGLLLDAFCDTLIKLAVRGPDFAALAAKHIDGRVTALIRELLHEADETRWLSLASKLPALAEASPDAFLNAVEDSLNRSGAPVKRLFAETESAASFSGRCWHAGMLWALETLGWAPQRLTRVSLILSRLADLEIAGNWGNTPLNSLVDLYRSWFPQTAATVEQRIAALDVLIDRQPLAAAKLLNALTNIGHDMASHTSRPKWRDDDAGAGYGATGIERHQMLVAAADRQLKLASRDADQIAALIGKYADFDDDRRQTVLALMSGFDDGSDKDKETIRTALRHKIHWHRNYGDQESVDTLLDPLEAVYDRLKPSDLVIEHAWLFKDGWVDLPVRHKDEDFEGRQVLSARTRAEALTAVFASEGWRGLARLADETNGGWTIGMHVVDAGVSLDDVIQWVSISAGELERGEQRTSLAAGILNTAIRREGHNVVHRFLASADSERRDLDWKVRLLTFALEEKATWDVVQSLGLAAHKEYWRQCLGNIWVHDDPPHLQYALTQLLEAGRPVTALRACHIKFKGIDPEVIMHILEGLLKGVEPETMLPQPYYIQEAIDYVEESGAIDRIRLAQIEFGLIKALGFDGEQHAASLYTVLMSQPEVFVELLCVLYRPKSGETEEVTEGGQAAASNAWSILHACKRQPGTMEDGKTTEESARVFVEKVRHLATEKDRAEVCDIQLGEIMARGGAGEDGVFPNEPIRNVIERTGSQAMLDGFRTGCFNKRGVTSRGVFDGGEQERALSAEYRANAKALEITHPQLAATLENLAKSYDRDGLAEDLEARLRREGR